MQISSLPADWSTHRATLHYLAAHLVGQARHRHDRMFDLVPTAGGFGTPMVGPSRERVRISSGSLVVERVHGSDIRALEASTTYTAIAGSSLNQLCAAVGFVPDPAFFVGGATPEFRDPDEPIELDAAAAAALGDWLALGRRAIDDSVSTIIDAGASVGRLWPEHFDYGTDLAVSPGVRCNLGAAAGDSFHEQPYLYVGPWDPIRPGDEGYWNAPFGAYVGFGELRAVDDPVETARRFFRRGLDQLRENAHHETAV